MTEQSQDRTLETEAVPTTSLREGAVNWIREIEDARQYSAVVARLLKTEEGQRELPADATWEDQIRKNRSRKIVHEILMPPAMQALHTERVILCEEVRHGPLDEAYVRVRITRVLVLQAHLAEWLIERLLPEREICSYLRGRTFTFGVGARWRMLVIEKLPLTLPGK